MVKAVCEQGIGIDLFFNQRSDGRCENIVEWGGGFIGADSKEEPFVRLHKQQDLIKDTGDVFAHAVRDAMLHVFEPELVDLHAEACVKKVIFVHKMLIKGCAMYTGSIANLKYGQVFKALFFE